MSLQAVHDGALVVLTLDRPRAAHALDGALQNALVDALAAAQADAEVRAVVLTASGERVFSAGADLKEYHDLAPAEAAVRRRTQLMRTLTTLVDFPKPIVCAVQGKAIGAGWMFALTCDQIVAADSASFSLPEIRIGTPTPIGVALLSHRVSESLAGRLAQSGESLGAIEALRLGLADQVVPLARLQPVARERAQAAGALAGEAYAGNKQWIHRALRERLLAAGALAASLHTQRT